MFEWGRNTQVHQAISKEAKQQQIASLSREIEAQRLKVKQSVSYSAELNRKVKNADYAREVDILQTLMQHKREMKSKKSY